MVDMLGATVPDRNNGAVYHPRPAPPSAAGQPEPPALPMSTPLAESFAPVRPLQIGYERTRLPDLLAQDDVLAVLAFGPTPHAATDPRVLQLGLCALDSGASRDALPLVEVWRSHGRVQHGRSGAVCWSHDDEFLFFAIEVDERDHVDVLAAAEYAYRAIETFVMANDMPHFLRLWNYLDAINDGSGDDERYRLFCAGRARGMSAQMHAGYPAATAIGRQDGVRVLQVYGLAARSAGTPIENPRQVSSWRYPRQYGPTSPTFARGMRVSPSQLLISGTAAVVGHASQHQGDLAAQLDETLANLHSLLVHAAGKDAKLDHRSQLKAYLRDPADADFIAAELRARAPDLGGLLVLAGDICRHELLLEIDGVQRLDA